MSVILHYSVSSCFSWCLVDSLFLYFTHTNSSHPLRKNIYYLLLGWGEYLAKNISKGESCNKKYQSPRIVGQRNFQQRE